MSRIIRPYQPSDRLAVRAIYGMDEFARPRLQQKYPRYGEYLADEMSYYPDTSRRACSWRRWRGRSPGRCWGRWTAGVSSGFTSEHIRPWLLRRTLSGAYGWPGWLPAVLHTEWAGRKMQSAQGGSGAVPGAPAHRPAAGMAAAGPGHGADAVLRGLLAPAGRPWLSPVCFVVSPAGGSFLLQIGIRMYRPVRLALAYRF